MIYKTIYVDPPWEFNDKLDDTRKKPYSTITLPKLMNLPIYKITDVECHLYLWCPATLLEWGFQLIKDWYFHYKTIIPWLKRYNSGKIWFGMGHYFRNCYEFLLFATKGNLKLKTKNTRNHLDAVKPNRHHAAKPEEAYELIENNSYPAYLELFATKKREGWTSIGYEIDGKDIMDLKWLK